ncbi:hypothetical protein [Microcoleus sp. CAWBG58]|uniref:hypothetical protein n=1 Tax=Microcoleus sp. CAWBG58 TaxID=2841651 RepID=UPI0025CC5EEC|nr:hypothetical protein [Microcoleus sp. CAWBG58]
MVFGAKGDRSFILGDRSSETTKGDRSSYNHRSIGIWCQGRSLNPFLYTYSESVVWIVVSYNDNYGKIERRIVNV